MAADSREKEKEKTETERGDHVGTTRFRVRPRMKGSKTPQRGTTHLLDGAAVGGVDPLAVELDAGLGGE